MNVLSLLQLHRHPANPARNLAGAGLDRISENGLIADLPQLDPKSSTSVISSRFRVIRLQRQMKKF